MNNDFSDLIKRFGTPKIVIPNTPMIFYQGYYGMITGKNPEDFNEKINSKHKIYYRRLQHGETEFLAVRSRYETWMSNENLLLEYFEKNDLKPVEFIYTYKNRWAWDYATEGWKEGRVSIAADADVEALSRENLLKAVDEKRLLWVCGWRSMGDGYVDFHICTPERLPTDSGYYFLFDEPCRLTDSMLARMGDGFERDGEFFASYADHFTRPFLMDK